jgi:hypothetical protein
MLNARSSFARRASVKNQTFTGHAKETPFTVGRKRNPKWGWLLGKGGGVMSNGKAEKILYFFDTISVAVDLRIATSVRMT